MIKGSPASLVLLFRLVTWLKWLSAVQFQELRRLSIIQSFTTLNRQNHINNFLALCCVLHLFNWLDSSTLLPVWGFFQRITWKNVSSFQDDLNPVTLIQLYKISEYSSRKTKHISIMQLNLATAEIFTQAHTLLLYIWFKPLFESQSKN